MAEQQQQDWRDKSLPALYNMSKGQLKLTGGALLASGIVDVAAHNPGVALAGLFVTGAVGYLSKDILDMFVPGSDGKAVEATARVVEALDPEEDDPYKDQSAKAKIMRLMGMKTPPLEYAPGEQENTTPAQPKDDRVAPPAGNEQEDDGPIFPIGPEQETLCLGTVEKTGQRFDPSFKKLFGRGWVAAANQGFGKSILNGVIIEQAGKCNLRVIVLDHKGEYGTVEELPFMNTLRAGNGSDFDFPLTADNADRFVESVMANRYQAIVDLPSYGDGWLDRAQIVAAVGQALMRHATRQRAAGKKMKQCLVILDEAQLYLPQNAGLLPAEARKNEGVLSDLNNAYFSLVSNGRSAGYTLGFATQSLTYLAKWAIKSTGVKIFGRHAERNDLNAIQEDIDPLVASRAEIESFPPGVGVVFGFTDKPMVVQFDNKQSRDVSFTPGFDDSDEGEISDLFDQQEDDEPMVVSFEEMCEAVTEMAKKGFTHEEIMQILDLTREEYREIVARIRGAYQQVPPSVSPSGSPFGDRPKLQVVAAAPKLDETASEVDAKGHEGAKGRGEDLSEISELELRIGRLYFGPEKLNPNAIVKKIWPDIKGGDAYQKKSAEVNEAIRKYVEVQRGA